MGARCRAEIGQGRVKTSGVVMGGPRRLNTSIASCRPGCGVQVRRSGAGLLAQRVPGARRAMSGVWPACAARCRRRRAVGTTGCAGHHSTAAQPPDRSANSVAQAASFAADGVIQIQRIRGRPKAAKAAVQGVPGGATQHKSSICPAPAPALDNQGASNANSPLAGATRSSVSPDSGQPPPGSSASSAGHPVGAVGVATGSIRPARHTPLVRAPASRSHAPKPSWGRSFTGRSDRAGWIRDKEMECMAARAS